MAFRCETVPLPQPRVQQEIKMTLYTKELYIGANANTIQDNPFGSNHLLGSIMGVADWPVTVGSDPSATVVGHLRGTYCQVSVSRYVWHFSFGLMFEDTWLNGSTLALSGTTSGIDGEWSIVGGTGQLNMATGTVKRRTIVEDGGSRVSELKIHAYYTPM
ncbi:hypothetical protein BS78_K079400 [Paspalum vaginatum]|uniref:Dirigent protein n=1 Tax=Paspalum vaginatum TaxID=158149 RepID=A0A9W8CFE8_9POAL|nr:hypothetical protein BS78_K079400 [Paspalum vaginatum]